MMPMLTMPEHKRAYQTQDLADWVLFWSAVNAQVHYFKLVSHTRSYRRVYRNTLLLKDPDSSGPTSSPSEASLPSASPSSSLALSLSFVRPLPALRSAH